MSDDFQADVDRLLIQELLDQVRILTGRLERIATICDTYTAEGLATTTTRLIGGIARGQR